MGDLKQAARLVRLQVVTGVDKAAILCTMGVKDEDYLGGIVHPQEIGDDVRVVCDRLPSLEYLRPILIPLHCHVYTQYLFPILAPQPTHFWRGARGLCHHSS